MYKCFSTPVISSENGEDLKEEGKQFNQQQCTPIPLTMSFVGEVFEELHDMIGEYSRPWNVEPVWALVVLAAAIIGLFLLPLLLPKKNAQFSHLRDPTCRTEKERLLTEQVWTSRTAIACLTRELGVANTKVALQDGQLEQLLAFVMDQEAESAGEIRSLKAQAARPEMERTLLLEVAQQQRQLIELLKEANHQRAASEAPQTRETPPWCVEGGDGGSGTTK